MNLAGQPEFSPRAWAGAGNGFSLGASSLRVVVSVSLSTALGLEISKSLLQQGWNVVLRWKCSGCDIFPVQQSLRGIPVGPHQQQGLGQGQGLLPALVVRWLHTHCPAVPGLWLSDTKELELAAPSCLHGQQCETSR